MLTKRARLLAASGLAFCTTACGSTVLGTRATLPVSSPPLVVALVAAVPSSSASAVVTGPGVATLRVQPRADLVARVLEALFEAFRTRNPAALEPWLEDDLVDLRGEGEAHSKHAFMLELQARLKSTAFEQLEIESVYRPRDVDIASVDDLADGRRPRPPAMTRSDLLVRVPILAPRLGGEVLFGDEIRLLLRKHGDRYRIRAYGEVVPRN